MSHGDQKRIELLLRAMEGNGTGASGELIELVYEELYRLAKWAMKSQPHSNTLQTGALINELYIRIQKPGTVKTKTYGHFLKLAAKVMRQILIDHARRKQARKREGKREELFLDNLVGHYEDLSGDLLAIEDALKVLKSTNPMCVEVVELRYFAGLSIADTASALGISRGEVSQYWLFAKGWLKRRLREGN